ncbi:hypothetical protein FQN54_004775 [Arachnomyces sp. PD_36]|nr:hypothetical protein FQN54_004775 [Arachnomyces sp. PD_36]
MDTMDIGRKRSYSDMQATESFATIDYARYCRAVFHTDDEKTEDAIEEKLIEEARRYELPIPERDTTQTPPSETPNDQTPSNTTTAVTTTTSSTTRNSICGRDISIDTLAASFSATTMSSLEESMKPDSLGSIASISTRPTSYSSNEGRIAVALEQPPKRSGHSRSSSLIQFAYSDKRLKQGLKQAFGKFPALRKRKNGLVVAAATRASLEMEKERKQEVDTQLQEATPLTPTQIEDAPTEPVSVEEMAAILRSQQNETLIKMQSSQSEVRDRHLLFEKEVFDALQQQHRRLQEERRLQHIDAEKENLEQNNLDAMKLEERHLTAELTLLEDFEREKQSCHTRIRHMEAYCTTPTPPATPQSDRSLSIDLSHPARKITKQQKDRLSQGYYERESMESLHESRIKVLRDRQERQYQNALRRMERELEQLVKTNEQNRRDLDKHCQSQHEETASAFEAKRERLTWRWSLEQMIARKKLEIQTGDTYGPLPELSFPKFEEYKPGKNDFSEIALAARSPKIS